MFIIQSDQSEAGLRIEYVYLLQDTIRTNYSETDIIKGFFTKIDDLVQVAIKLAYHHYDHLRQHVFVGKYNDQRSCVEISRIQDERQISLTWFGVIKKPLNQLDEDEDIIER